MFCTLTHGQTFNKDSLVSQLNNSSNSEKCEIYFQLARKTLENDKLQALSYVENGQKLARVIGDSLKYVRGGRLKGQVLRRLDRLTEALNSYEEVINIARNNLDNPEMFEEYKNTISSLAIVNTFLANYDKALNYNFQLLTIVEKHKDLILESDALNNIGLVYFKLKNYDLSIRYYEGALKLKKDIGDDYNMERLLINIGLVYNQMLKFEEAEKYASLGLKSCSDQCDNQVKMEGLYALGMSLFGQKMFDKAKVNFLQSLTLADAINSKRFRAENLTFLGRIALQDDDINKAKVLFNEAIALSKESGYAEILINIYRNLSNYYYQAESFQDAAVYQERYIVLRDSTYNEAMIKNISQIQTNFAERENIATIAAKEKIIQQQRELSLAVIVIAFLAGLLVVVLQRTNRTIKRVNVQLSEAKETIQEQNKLLESKNRYLDREVEEKTDDLERANQSLKQVNEELDNFIYKTSHDIRGPLASLKGMCNVALLDVKDPVAIDYLLKLNLTAERLNTILTRLLIINQINNSKLTLSSIDFESVISDVMILERKRGFPKKVSFRKHIDPDVQIYSDKELLRIVLENLIDNAIKFYNDSDRVDSFVEVTVEKHEHGGAKVRILDNGIGISESNPGKLFRMFFRASERSETGGIGLYIVKTATAKLGGRVGLNTTPEGYTEFYVVFPQFAPSSEDIKERPLVH
jgi:signal transduction histidine kinase